MVGVSVAGLLNPCRIWDHPRSLNPRSSITMNSTFGFVPVPVPVPVPAPVLALAPVPAPAPAPAFVPMASCTARAATHAQAGLLDAPCAAMTVRASCSPPHCLI